MKDFNVKYLRILRLRFGLVGIASFYAPAQKETVANTSGSERCVLIPWLFLFLDLLVWCGSQGARQAGTMFR